MTKRKSFLIAMSGGSGSGKSTLCRIIAGRFTPSEGTVKLDGVEMHFRRPSEAREAGIEMVHQDLSSGFPLFNMLAHWNGGLQHQPIALDGAPFSIPACPDLAISAIPLRSSAPPYSPHRGNPHPGDNIGLFVEDRRTGGTLFYAPGLGQVDEALLAWMRRADCLLVDGTLWRDDEMRQCEVGDKLGSEMGHLCQSGPGGMIEIADGAIATSGIGRRIWQQKNGGFAHHLIDPASGKSAWTGLAGVTQIAPTTLVAETMAKTAVLSGPEIGRRIVANNGGVLFHLDGSVERVEGAVETHQAIGVAA